MKYVFSDFYLLVGATDKACRTVGDAYRRMSELMGIPVSAPCLLYALQGLCAGGYVTVEPTADVITVDTPLALTDAGKAAATVSGLQRFFGEAKSFNKKELRFCELERPAEAPSWTVDTDGFSRMADELLQNRTVSYPLFEITDEGGGQLTLTLHHPAREYRSEDEADASAEVSEDTAPSNLPYFVAGDPDEAATVDMVTVTGSAESILQGATHLLETAHALLNAPRTHKVALHGSTGSYVVTLAHAASEFGTALRMTVSQIRFNRQRFYGKRDSDLDYAQCGSPLITTEMGGAKEFAARLLPCLMSCPALLDEESHRIIEAIHTNLKK